MFVNTWYTVNSHRLENPPDTLYRVAHSGNRGNVLSSRAEPKFQTHDEVPTPFLSAFVHYRHAHNWAAQRIHKMGDNSVRIHEITTDGLLVFGAGGGEFLVLDEIPNANVVSTYSMQVDDSNIDVESDLDSDSDSSSDGYY